MRLRINARHMELTNTLREHVERRFLDSLSKHFDRESCELRVEIDRGVGEGKRRYDEVHAQLNVPGALLIAHGRAKNPFTAVDVAQKQLLRQLDEWRGRLYGNRFPTKYYAARLVEEERTPTFIPSPGPVQPDAELRLHESGSSPTPLRPPGSTMGSTSGEAATAMALEGSATSAVEDGRRARSVAALLRLLAGRRSVRRFRDAPLGLETLRALEEAVSLAPSMDNLEARRFVFVRDPGLRELLGRATRGQAFVAEAPLVVVCCAHLGSASIHHLRGTQLYAPMDVAAAVENLLLVAHVAGLGATWVGEFDEGEVARLLDLPEELRPVSLVAVGWPDEHPEAPRRLPRDELVREL